MKWNFDVKWEWLIKKMGKMQFKDLYKKENYCKNIFKTIRKANSAMPKSKQIFVFLPFVQKTKRKKRLLKRPIFNQLPVEPVGFLGRTEVRCTECDIQKQPCPEGIVNVRFFFSNKALKKHISTIQRHFFLKICAHQKEHKYIL